jgi:hypothetical protein
MRSDKRPANELRAKERRPLSPVNLDDAPQLEAVDQLALSAAR